MHILVIDVGTSSIRGILYDKQGKKLFCHQIPYQVHFAKGILAEQNGADWSETIVEIAKEALRYCEKADIACDALSLTSQRSRVIPVDRK